MGRTSAERLDRIAAAHLRLTLEAAGIDPHVLDGIPVTGRAVIDADNWDELTDPDGVVVADVVTAGAREHLIAAGRSWWDRRGHLHLRTPRDRVVIDTAPFHRAAAGPAPPGNPLSGVAVHVALDALLNPSPSGVRQLARTVEASPSTVSRARTALTDRGLLDDTGAPSGPDLFWALADAWPRLAPPVRLDRIPPGGLAVGPDAAAAAGAPIAVAAGAPPDLLLPPDAADELRFLAESDRPQAAATIAAAPSPLALTPHPDGTAAPSGHLLAHPVVIALALAADPARGAEAVRDWTPEVGRRVW